MLAFQTGSFLDVNSNLYPFDTLQPYDMVFEMEEINEDWDDVDVTLVIGGTITWSCVFLVC